MSVVSYNVFTPGLIGVAPRIVQMTTTDDLPTITAAGYLNRQGQVLQGLNLSPTDEIHTIFSYVAATNSGTFEVFLPTIASNGTITLNAWVDTGNVLLPVVSGNFATFNGTSGQIKDAGFLPSDATKTKVVMAGSAVQTGYIAHFVDVSGTVDDTAGAVINAGTIQSGLAGTVGGFIAFPPTTGNGFLELLAINAGGAFNTIISNSAMGQTSTISIPDPGGATSKFLLTNSASGQTIATGGLDLSVGSVRALQGNFQAGSDAHAGTFTSFPGTTGNGSFVFAALNAGGAFVTTLKNSIMGQSSTINIPDPANAVGQLLIGASATPFVSGNLPKASGTAGLMIDSGIAASGLQILSASVSLNQAQIQGMFAAPFQIIAPPAAGHIIVPVQATIYTNFQTAAFANGGVAILQYDNTVNGAGTNALEATIPAAEITAASSQIYSLDSAVGTALTGITAKGLFLSNQTQAFTGGNAASTVVVTVSYYLITASV